MYIDTSRVSMTSSRSYSKIVYAQKAEMTMSSSEADVFSLSKEGKSAVEQLEDYKKEVEKKEAEQQKKNMKDSYSRMLTNRANQVEDQTMELTSAEELKMQLIQKLLASFARRKSNRYSSTSDQIWGYTKSGVSCGFSYGSSPASGTVGEALMVDTNTTSAWKRVTAVSCFQGEMEQTSYQANGMVITKDGRQINFGVTVEMSRAFCQKFESLTVEDVIFTDPLVINLDSNVAKVTDQKFLFDLDSDGKEEEISFVGKGSGFLALDKNEDGIINDGSELFGTKSGDGFKDLAAYDQDGNGWIDEADDIFKYLKVWTKDEEGNDYLMSLKDADIGAIFLDKVATQFSLNEQETNSTNAMIRSTGVFLRESSGAVGTVQHVDLAV